MDTARTEHLRELVAHAWFTIGYPPADSLVLLELSVSGDPGLVLRVDQPPPEPPATPGGAPRPATDEHRRLVARLLAEAAGRAGVRRAGVLVVHEPAGVSPPAFGPPEAALVGTLRRALRAAGIDLDVLALVGAGLIRCLAEGAASCGCPQGSACCPSGGIPLGDLATTAAAARMVLGGRALAADEAGVVADVAPRPWPPSVLLTEPPAAAPPLGLARWRALHAARLQAPPPRPEPSPQEVAWLVPGLADARLRDAVLVSMLPAPAPGPGSADPSAPRRPPDPAADLAAGRVRGPVDLTGLAERPPDPEVFEVGRELLAAVARGAPAGSRAEALAVLAWMAWWEAAGARGRLLVARALEDRPEHRLAGIVDRLLAYGVPPSWVPEVRRAGPAGGGRPPARGPAGGTARGRG